MSKLLNYVGRKLIQRGPEFKFSRQNYATRKRFYKSTGIVQNEKKWEVTLDHRRLKTPNGGVLLIDSEPLARAIAVEWDSQTEVISQATMHLTALCNTAIDNPGKLTRHDIISYILDVIATDTVLFQAEEGDLKTLQHKRWDPILEWFDSRFGTKLEVSRDLQPPPFSTDSRAALAKHLLSYDFASLNALNFGVEALKSPVLMLACAERRLEPKEAVFLSRLEEEFQVIQWGRVHWAHELSQVELTSRVSAALLVLHCSNEKHYTTAKAPPGDNPHYYSS